MNALATAPGVIATPGKYYIGAQEVTVLLVRITQIQILGHGNKAR